MKVIVRMFAVIEAPEGFDLDRQDDDDYKRVRDAIFANPEIITGIGIEDVEPFDED